MSNFNQFFRSQGAKTIVEKFFTGIDRYNDKAKLTDLKWSISEEGIDKPASYFIENGLTATFKVNLEYTINYDDSDVRYSEFEVPREIDGCFIIEGAYRVATNTLGNDYECRINMSGSGRYYINFDYDRDYDINSGVLRIKRTNPELGLPEKVREYKLEEVDNIRGLEREVLRLTERQSKKLQIKLDLDYKPEYITSKLIQECMAFGDDRIKDMVVDKKIESVSSGFMNFLFKNNNRGNFNSTYSSIRHYWTKFSKLQDTINVLTLICAKYWKGSSDSGKGGNDPQVSPGINAMNLESLTNKIQIPPSVAYNKSFSDLICVGATPINQNVGKQNALTVSTHVTDTDVLFDCYDLKFNKITISYLDYLNHKVCASEYVDYDTNTLKPDANGMVEVKHRMKRKTVPVSEVEFIDLHPDYRLSEEVRQIPFVNYTDSVRVHMGSSMLKQAIPLPLAERPLVSTGNYEELHTNVLNDRFKHPKGKVKEINEKEVIIELPNKETVEVPRRTAIQSVNDVAVYTEPKVKVGQTVREGDVITGAVGLETDTYKPGINALVLFHAMFGYVNEDALVVSESFSKKMHSYSIIDLSVDVKSSEAIKWIAPIGHQVKSGDVIFKTYRAVQLDEINKALQEKLGGIFGDDVDVSQFTTENPTKVPNNIDEAYVSDVLIQENKKPRITKGIKRPDLTYSRTSNKYIKEYEKNMDRSVIYERYPEYIAADRLKPVILDKNERVVYTVRIRLIKRTNLMIGSKVTNRFGGKGVISKILPDNKMPLMIDPSGKKKVCDIVMNPYSTINRKIPSVLLESGLGNIAHRIHDIVEERKNSPKERETILPLVKKYYPGRFDSMTLDQFIDYHNKNKLEDVYYFNVGSYSTKFTPSLVEQWSDELGVKSQSEILMPADSVADLNELKENLPPDEYEKTLKDLDGKYVPTDKPLMCGYICMEELYHIPTYSNKVTSSLFGVDINEYKDSPIMGRGKYRTTGQKIGEMELSAYLARGAKEFIESARGDTAQEDNQIFLNNLLGLGLTVTDSKGYNQGGSNLKGRLGDMKVKFRLKNQK